MCNHFPCFCRGPFSRFGASLEGSKTSALQREHVLEQPEAQKLGQRCSGSTIRNERKRGNEASAAAGTRFGRSGSPKMRPAPKREQYFEKNTSENHVPQILCVKKQYAGGCRISSGRHQGKWESIFILCNCGGGRRTQHRTRNHPKTRPSLNTYGGPGAVEHQRRA